MTKSLALQIEGMHCDGCVRRVKAALAAVPGVAVQTVEVGRAEVSFDPAQATPQAVADAVNGIGFRASSGDRHA